mmetsp:Transcript_9265/g.17052  ORF Transcript_9265/g.17052 Transcript_9265/m.17052 type:complete len:310 (+) Transcript_9265:34-963(+)
MGAPVALFYRILSLWGLQHAFANDDEAVCTEASATSMLQLATRMEASEQCGHLTVQHCDPQSKFMCSNNCRIHTHSADCYRPLPEVLAEHPGVDGYCYFNATSFYVIYSGPSPAFEEEAAEGILGVRGPLYKGLNTGPLITYEFEGVENLTTFVDSSHYSYDDLYAFSLGFLQGQGLDPVWMKNTSLWISLSEKKCNAIKAKYNFTPTELVLADWLNNNSVLSAKTMCSAGLSWHNHDTEVARQAGWRSREDCQPVTARDFAKHHYVKCLLGYRNSASDMAYLNSRACLLEGNHIGHFSECPYTPDVSF